MARKYKEALVLLVDTGPSAIKNEVGNVTFLEQSVECIKQVLLRKIFSESKDEVAIIAYGSEDTDNPLSGDDGYNNISIQRQLLPVTWELVEVVEKRLKQPGRTTTVDFIDALVVAFDHIKTKTETWKQTERQIYLLSPFQDRFCSDQLETVIKALVNHGVRVMIIGPDKEDGEQGMSKIPSSTYEVVQRLVDETKGLWFTFKETMESISQILPRIPNPTPWKTNLTIGKLKIPISAYLKVKKHPPKSWKRCYKGDKTVTLTTERSYHKFDEAQTECETQDIVERYKYGSSLVIYTAEDKANMEYRSDGKCLTVLGFTKLQNIKRHHYFGDGVYYIAADKTDVDYAKTGTAFSAIVHALYELDMVAIARRVYMARSAPVIGFLKPLIKDHYLCLSFVQLPYMEDLRLYTFQSLNMADCKEDDLQLVDELIDAMSSNKSEGKSLLQTKIDNPYIRRLFQCVSHRNLYPETPLIEADNAHLFSPTKQMVTVCSPISLKLKKAFSLEKVEHAQKRTAATVFQQTSEDNNTDIEAKLAKLQDTNDVSEGVMTFTAAKATSVGAINPVDDFTKIISDNPQEKINASKQMQKVIFQLVTDSVGDLLRQEIYNKAIKCLQILRKELLKDHPALFNDFMIELKELILTKRREQLWDMISLEKIGLITVEESSISTVTKEAGEIFFTVEKEDKVDTSQMVDDIDDLVGEM